MYKQVVLLLLIVSVFFTNCSDNSPNEYKNEYEYALTYKFNESDLERYGYDPKAVASDTSWYTIYSDTKFYAYEKAIEMYFSEKEKAIKDSKRKRLLEYPDTFYLRNKVGQDISKLLSKDTIDAIRKRKLKDYDLDIVYEVFERFCYKPNEAGIRQCHSIIKINPKYKNKKDTLLSEVGRNIGLGDEYNMVYGYFENPPSLKDWIKNNKLNPNISQSAALIRKGRKTADYYINVPSLGFGKPFYVE